MGGEGRVIPALPPTPTRKPLTILYFLPFRIIDIHSSYHYIYIRGKNNSKRAHNNHIAIFSQESVELELVSINIHIFSGFN